MENTTGKEFNTIDVAKQQREIHRNAGAVGKEFENLADFKEFALGPQWSPQLDRIHISEIPYTLIKSQKVDWIAALMREGKPLVAIYTQPHGAWKAEGEKTGLAQWVVIVWRLTNGNIIKPMQVFTTRKQTYSSRIKEIGSEQTSRTIGEAVDQENLIGATAMMKVTSLSSSKEMKARVDTGATISSIHCDRWKVNGDSVEFVSKELSPNVITLPLVTHQATRTSDGGTENRPVIELNVRINGKVLQGMQFNLNNRQHMEYPVLIGQNILQKGKFLIDPSMVSEEVIDKADDVNWDALYEELSVLEENVIVDDLMAAADNQPSLLDVMMNSDMTFKELIKQSRRLEYARDDSEDK